MKKRVSVIIVLCMIMVLAVACSKKEEGTEDVTKTAEVSPEVTEAVTATPEEKTNEVEPIVTDEPKVTLEPVVTTELIVTSEPEVTAEPELTAEPEVTQEPEVTAGVGLTENTSDLEVAYYKIVFMEMGYDREVVEEFLKAYEAHGIYPMVVEVNNDGTAKLVSGGETDETISLQYDDRYFFSEEYDMKILYIYKNEILTLYTSSAISSIELEFGKMTEEEIKKYNEGYTPEAFDLAEEEAEEVLRNADFIDDDSYMSYIEQSRRSTDIYNYDLLVDACKFALADPEVKNYMAEGHSCRILFTKDGTFVFIDGDEATEDNLFYAAFKEFVYDPAEYSVMAKVNTEYIIDVNSDGEVVQIVAPETEE